MALATRRPQLGLTTGIETCRITGVSRMVSRYTGMDVPPNKAILSGTTGSSSTTASPAGSKTLAFKTQLG